MFKHNLKAAVNSIRFFLKLLPIRKENYFPNYLLLLSIENRHILD